MRSRIVVSLALAAAFVSFSSSADGRGPLEEASAYVSTGAFARGAATLERWAIDAPDDPAAARALVEATRLRLALGTPDLAEHDLATLREQYSAPRFASELAEATFAVADDAVAAGHPSGARLVLEAAMPACRKAGVLRIELGSEVRLGRAFAALGEQGRALAAFARAVGVARRSGPWAEEERDRAKDGDAWDREARDLAGEAFFFLAEARDAEVPRRSLPPFVGAETRESVAAYVRSEVGPWFHYAEARARFVVAAYERVVGGGASPDPPDPRLPEPRVTEASGDPSAPWGPVSAPPWRAAASPRWAIRAAAKVGAMWSELYDTARRVPVVRDPVVDAFCNQPGTNCDIESSVLPRYATRAFETCVRLSVEHHLFDDTSRACEAWLGEHRKADHHTMDEAFASPGAPSPADAPGEPRLRVTR